MTFRSSSRTVFQSDRPAASSSAPGRSLNGTGAQRSSSDEPVLKTVICLDLHSLGHRSRFRSVRGTELRTSVGEVSGDRVRTEAETPGDVLVGQTVSSKIEDLKLAFAQRRSDCATREESSSDQTKF